MKKVDIRVIVIPNERSEDDCMDAGGRATQEAKADDCMDAGGRATQEAKADDCMGKGCSCNPVAFPPSMAVMQEVRSQGWER